MQPKTTKKGAPLVRDAAVFFQDRRKRQPLRLGVKKTTTQRSSTQIHMPKMRGVT